MKKNIEIDLDYDHYIVAFSGGKDSISCFLHLIEIGVPVERIELWHHLVDGREGPNFMDWPVTEDYCQKFADHFGVPIFFSWKEGGFEREMLRNNQATAPTWFEGCDDNGFYLAQAGGKGKPGTRLKFPQVSADLKVRWCSPYLKIDPCTAAVRNQTRFYGKRTIIITGERFEESAARAKYKPFEIDRSDLRNGRINRRHVDHWRPVHHWPEKKIWATLKRHGINPHPAYKLGCGRLSCRFCVFLSPAQIATLSLIDPPGVQKLVDYERQFGHTMKRNRSIPELVDKGIPYPAIFSDPGLARIAMSATYNDNLIVDNWEMPAGAFGENTGPS